MQRRVNFKKKFFIILYFFFKVNDVSILDQLQSIDDYFPLFTEQTLQLYALRMKDNEDQIDIVVS